MTRSRFALLLPLLLCACPGSIPGPVGQLDSLKAAEKEGRLDDITNASISSDCTPGTPLGSQACPQILEIRGRACLQKARNSLPSSTSQAAGGLLTACPLPAQRANLDCAATDLGAARQSDAFPSSQADDIGEMQSQALYCEANLSAPAERLALAKRAADTLSQITANPRRDDLHANVALNLARNSQLAPTEQCLWARQSVALANHGLQNGPSASVLGGLNSVRSGASDFLAKNNCGAG